MHKARHRHHRPLLLILAAAGLLATGPALAQDDVPRGATVMDRERAAVDPLGVQLGGFMVFPSVTGQLIHDDNVTAADTNTRSDWLSVIAPMVRADSTWSVHDLKASAGARIGRHGDLDGWDFEDYFVNADGRLDITRANAIHGRLAFDRLHEDAGDPDRAGSTRTTQYTVGEGRLRYTHNFNRLGTEVDGSIQTYDYKNDASQAVPASERDRTIYRLGVRGDWRFSEELAAFGRVAGNWRDTHATPTGGRPDRSSNGWDVNGGVAFDLTGVTVGEVFVGYRAQTYDSAALKDVRGASFGAEVVNNFTRLTTFTLRVVNSVEETTAGGASSYVQNTLSLKADHELRRNILLHGGLGYNSYGYQGIDRDAARWSGSGGVTWLANRHMHIKGEYTYTDHDESGAASANDWRRNMVMVSLQLHL